MSATERASWARGLIARASGPVPAYGSTEWLRLPEGDPRKVAAVVAAAECWALDGDHLEERLWEECLTSSRASKADDDAEWRALSGAHRSTWTGLDKLIGHPLAAARRQRLGDVA